MAILVEVLKSIVPLAWPILVAIVLWKIWPTAKKIIEARSFTVKFGGMEITVQEATEQIKSQLQDLTDQIIELKRHSGKAIEHHIDPSASKDAIHKSILWVDDRPKNNALEISQLQERGYRTITALSTREAMATLAKERVGLIISDMGRHEDKRYVSQAGLILLKAARESGYNQPFAVYCSPKYAEINDAEVKASGGVGATASPTTLLEWIENVFQ